LRVVVVAAAAAAAAAATAAAAAPVGVGAISVVTLGIGLTGLEFCDLMLASDSRVIAFPMALFYDRQHGDGKGRTKEASDSNTMVRFSICKSPAYVDAALAKLAQVPVPRGAATITRA
jgi:hypothetical protein